MVSIQRKNEGTISLGGKSILLLPIAWLIRIVKGITKKERIRRYKAIAKDSSKQMEKMLTIYETLNLKFRR